MDSHQIKGTRAHKIALDPSKGQIKALEQTAQTYKYIYNSALATAQNEYLEFTGYATLSIYTEGPGWKSKERLDRRQHNKILKLVDGELSSEVLEVGKTYQLKLSDKALKKCPEKKCWCRVDAQTAPTRTDKPKLGDDMRKAFDRRLKAGLTSKDGSDLSAVIVQTAAQTRNRAFVDLQSSFKNFFAGRTEYPTFHKEAGSFYVSNQMLSFIDPRHIKLGTGPLGRIKTKEAPRFVGKVMSATVSKTAGQWYAAVVYQDPIVVCRTAPTVKRQMLGIDLNLTAETAVMASSGRAYVSPRPMKGDLGKRLKLLSRRASRAVQGSQNWKQIQAQVAKIQAHMANKRQDFTHKTTTDIANSAEQVVVEDLNVKAMQMSSVASGIQDSGIGEFRRILGYKVAEQDGTLWVADRWYPSSKVCHLCGWKNPDLALSHRTFDCGGCGLSIGRDLNAAKRVLAAVASGDAVNETQPSLAKAKTAELKTKEKMLKIKAAKQRKKTEVLVVADATTVNY